MRSLKKKLFRSLTSRKLEREQNIDEAGVSGQIAEKLSLVTFLMGTLATQAKFVLAVVSNVESKSVVQKIRRSLLC